MSNPQFFDEMYAGPDSVRPHYGVFADWLRTTTPDFIAQKREEADRAFHRMGITFAVYGEDAGTERLIPFDIMPRMIPPTNGACSKPGLIQRVRALNLFLHDIYHDQDIIKDGENTAPRRSCSNTQFRPRDAGRRRRRRHLRAYRRASTSCAPATANIYVLEDNLRVPSGVSYMLENRKMMMRLFPELFATPVDRAGRALPRRAARQPARVAPAGAQPTRPWR